LEDVKEINHLGGLDIDGKTMLTYIWNIYDARAWFRWS